MNCTICGKIIEKGQRFYRAPSGRTKHRECSSLAASPGSGNEEKLRAEIVRLKTLLKQADWLIVEHHSCAVMRDEHDKCPICTGAGMELLTAISAALRADAGNSPNVPDEQRP